MKLSSPVTFNKHVQPVCVTSSSLEFKNRNDCWVTGWGNIGERQSEAGDRRAGEGSTVHQALCRAAQQLQGPRLGLCPHCPLCAPSAVGLHPLPAPTTEQRFLHPHSAPPPFRRLRAWSQGPRPTCPDLQPQTAGVREVLGCTYQKSTGLFFFLEIQFTKHKNHPFKLYNSGTSLVVVVKTLPFHRRGAWVQSLAGELKSHILCDMTKKKKSIKFRVFFFFWILRMVQVPPLSNYGTFSSSQNEIPDLLAITPYSSLSLAIVPGNH